MIDNADQALSDSKPESAEQPEPPRDSSTAPHDLALKNLLKNALSTESSDAELLPGVQKRLRERSRGKFYTNRWATDRHPPISTYLVTSLFMLAVLLAVFAVIYPIVGNAEAIHNEPAPVRVVPAPASH